MHTTYCIWAVCFALCVSHAVGSDSSLSKGAVAGSAQHVDLEKSAPVAPVVAHEHSESVKESASLVRTEAAHADNERAPHVVEAATKLAHETQAPVVANSNTKAKVSINQHGEARETKPQAVKTGTTAEVAEPADKMVQMHIAANGNTENAHEVDEFQALHKALLQREQAAGKEREFQHSTSGKGSSGGGGRAPPGRQSAGGFGAPTTMAPMRPMAQSSCFPPHTEVKVMDMSTGRELVKAMRHVEVGDHVATVDDQGRHSWSPVQFFLHRDTEPTEYVELVWGTGSKAHVSPSHLVWRADGQHVAAGELKVGDKVFTHSRVGAAPNVELVTSTALTSFGGRYHPVTGHETIVVDSLVASTHSTRTKPMDGSHRRAYAFTRMMLSGLYHIAPRPVSRWWNGEVVPSLVPMVDWIMA